MVAAGGTRIQESAASGGDVICTVVMAEHDNVTNDVVIETFELLGATGETGEPSVRPARVMNECHRGAAALQRPEVGPVPHRLAVSVVELAMGPALMLGLALAYPGWQRLRQPKGGPFVMVSHHALDPALQQQ